MPPKNRSFDDEGFFSLCGSAAQAPVTLNLPDRKAADRIRYEFYMWRKQASLSMPRVMEIVCRRGTDTQLIFSSSTNDVLRTALSAVGIKVGVLATDWNDVPDVLPAPSVEDATSSGKQSQEAIKELYKLSPGESS